MHYIMFHLQKLGFMKFWSFWSFWWLHWLVEGLVTVVVFYLMTLIFNSTNMYCLYFNYVLMVMITCFLVSQCMLFCTIYSNKEQKELFFFLVRFSFLLILMVLPFIMFFNVYMAYLFFFLTFLFFCLEAVIVGGVGCKKVATVSSDKFVEEGFFWNLYWVLSRSMAVGRVLLIVLMSLLFLNLVLKMWFHVIMYSSVVSFWEVMLFLVMAMILVLCFLVVNRLFMERVLVWYDSGV